MKTKAPLRFGSLPPNYAGLCALLMPRPIHDKVGYRNALEIVEAFAGFESRMNRDQNDYFELLSDLIADYEDAAAPKVSPLKLLAHLMGEHGMTGADLSNLLGVTRAVGPMILRGERSITAAHARALGKHFGLPAGLFIE